MGLYRSAETVPYTQEIPSPRSHESLLMYRSFLLLLIIVSLSLFFRMPGR